MPSTKISVTLDDASLSWLRQRAKQLHGGNLSAAISEATELARKQDALREFLDSEGAPEPSPAEIAAIKAEWHAPIPARSAGRRSPRRA